MDHAALLNILFPLELGSVHGDDLALEGSHLDEAQTSAEMLLVEMFGDTADETLSSWERVLGLTAGINTEEARRLAVKAKLAEMGGQSRAYFLAMALSLGVVITISEFDPFTCGTAIDQPIYPEEIRYVWQVNVTMPHPPYALLEKIFRELKPAHTAVIFKYTPISGGWETGLRWGELRPFSARFSGTTVNYLRWLDI